MAKGTRSGAFNRCSLLRPQTPQLKRGTNGTLAPRAGSRHDPAPMQSRSNYKATWDALAQSQVDAQLHVAGHLDESEWARSARVTLGVLEEFVGIRPEDEILEIGCGLGRVGRVLAPRCRRWIGGDVSPKMLEHTRRLLADLPNVELVELSGVDLAPIPDASVDVVYCTVVFMHLYEWDRYRYVQEAMRVLRPGGRCYFDNVDITTDHGWEVFSAGAAYPPEERPAHLSMVSTADELRTYGERAGFEQVQVRPWGGAWVALTGVKPARS